MNRTAIDSREDDFPSRREHLEDLTDEQLARRFWELAREVVDPLVDLAREHTSPSIERSVLLRMGFSSVEAGHLVRDIADRELLGKGAGHVVLRAARALDVDVRTAGLELIEGRGWDTVEDAFGSGGGAGC
ncbi:MAG: ornithine aminomutase subunit alpha [Clostridia bacterium]